MNNKITKICFMIISLVANVLGNKFSSNEEINHVAPLDECGNAVHLNWDSFSKNCDFGCSLNQLFSENIALLKGNYSSCIHGDLQPECQENLQLSDVCTNALQILQDKTSSASNMIIQLTDQLENPNIFHSTISEIKKNMLCLNTIVRRITAKATREYIYKLEGNFYEQYSALVEQKLYNILKIAAKIHASSKIPTVKRFAQICQIELRGSGGAFMYAHPSMGTDNLQRPVYLDIGVNGTAEAEWIFEPVDGDNDNLFKIRNSKYNEYFGSFVPWPVSSILNVDTVTSSQLYAECDSRYLWTKTFEGSDNSAMLKHHSTGALLLTPGTEFPLRQAVLDMKAGHVLLFRCTNSTM